MSLATNILLYLHIIMAVSTAPAAGAVDTAYYHHVNDKISIHRLLRYP